MILVWAFGVAFVLAVLFIGRDVWRYHRQDRKRLLDDYDRHPYRGSSVKRTVRHRARGSSYGAQHDGSYVPHISTFDSHSHGGDYSSDSCDSGGSDGGGCGGGD